MVFNRPFLQFLKKGEAILLAGLKDIPDDHDRCMEMVGDVEDILGQKLRIPVSRPFPVCHGPKGLCRASAGLTVIDTSPTGKDSSHGVTVPVDKGLIAGRINIPHHLLHDVAVIDGDIIQGFGNVSQGIDLDSILLVPPREVRTF
jgi:hypothetical protein